MIALRWTFRECMETYRMVCRSLCDVAAYFLIHSPFHLQFSQLYVLYKRLLNTTLRIECFMIKQRRAVPVSASQELAAECIILVEQLYRLMGAALSLADD